MNQQKSQFVKPIERVNKTIQERITDKLRYAIQFGELPGGTRLLQDELAQKFGVSITPIREAIKTLASEGLVKIDPYRGAMVYEVSKSEFEIILHLRLVIETYAIQFTIKNITPEQINQLENILNSMAETDDFEEWFGLNHTFHAVLNEATGSESLIQLQNMLRNLANFYYSSSPQDQRSRMFESNEDHRKLIEACCNKDIDLAVEVVSKHSQMWYKHTESS